MAQPITHRTVLLARTQESYFTRRGAAYVGDSAELLLELPDDSIDLVVSSPPFALLRQKEYGNESQSEYVDWLLEFASRIRSKLGQTGSFVLDLGGAYERGTPSRSLYNFRVPIRMVDELGYVLAEDFYWFNPSKLPSPIEWVNKRKLRAKDAVNTVWWFTKSPWAKADVSKVLTPYSDRMKQLLKNPSSFYQPARRPSGHDISENFGNDNGGAIPSNLLQIPNTESNGQYVDSCKIVGARRHPARFPAQLPQFFIRMLTDPGDVVLDIFAGSNTTGMVAEADGREWLAFDADNDYVASSSFRFLPAGTADSDLKAIYDRIRGGECVDLTRFNSQMELFA